MRHTWHCTLFALLALYFAAVANATPVNWRLNGVTIEANQLGTPPPGAPTCSTNGTAYGTFVYDADTKQAASVVITVVAPCNGTIYHFSTAFISSPTQLAIVSATPDGSGSVPENSTALYLSLMNPLTDAGGMVDVTAGGDSMFYICSATTCPVVSGNGFAAAAAVEAGAVVSYVPTKATQATAATPTLSFGALVLLVLSLLAVLVFEPTRGREFRV